MSDGQRELSDFIEQIAINSVKGPYNNGAISAWFFIRSAQEIGREIFKKKKNRKKKKTASCSRSCQTQSKKAP